MHLKKLAHLRKSLPLTAAMGVGAVVLVVICVATAAMLIAARRSSQPSHMSVAEPQPESVVEPQPEKVAAESTAKKAPVAHARTPQVTASKARAEGAVVPARTLTADATAKAPAAEPASNALAPEPAPVTITGCLERDDETFRLKDTTGADAPKARSWKTGFLKKGSASIEVVDATNRVRLPDHVGQRVSVTGRLVDREMQVRSLQRLAPSCN